MNPATLQILRDEVARRGSRQAVADAIGYSRTAVSLALSGRYPARTTTAFERAVRSLIERVVCPHLGVEVGRAHCRATALVACPTHTPEALAAWRACQSCPHRPEEDDDDRRRK